MAMYWTISRTRPASSTLVYSAGGTEQEVSLRAYSSSGERLDAGQPHRRAPLVHTLHPADGPAAEAQSIRRQLHGEAHPALRHGILQGRA